uniref:Uncharacterized protein n=1 Tax=Arundo donax TaxID=35708 RepID=A0A0A9CDX8_ARUDO
MLHRISAHRLMLGRFLFVGARHCRASSYIFSTARLIASVASRFESSVWIALPETNFSIAHFVVTRSMIALLGSIGRLPVTNSTSRTPKE